MVLEGLVECVVGPESVLEGVCGFWSAGLDGKGMF